MKDNLESPCKNCPFRKGGEGVGLLRERFEEIIGHHTVFPCHKTVDYDDDDGKGKLNPGSQACAGFLGFMMKTKGPNQLMQVGFRFGILDEKKAERLASHPDIIDTIEEGTLQHRYGKKR